LESACRGGGGGGRGAAFRAQALGNSPPATRHLRAGVFDKHNREGPEQLTGFIGNLGLAGLHKREIKNVQNT